MGSINTKLKFSMTCVWHTFRFVVLEAFWTISTGLQTLDCPLDWALGAKKNEKETNIQKFLRPNIAPKVPQMSFIKTSAIQLPIYLNMVSLSTRFYSHRKKSFLFMLLQLLKLLTTRAVSLYNWPVCIRNPYIIWIKSHYFWNFSFSLSKYSLKVSDWGLS